MAVWMDRVQYVFVAKTLRDTDYPQQIHGPHNGMRVCARRCDRPSYYYAVQIAEKTCQKNKMNRTHACCVCSRRTKGGVARVFLANFYNILSKEFHYTIGTRWNVRDALCECKNSSHPFSLIPTVCATHYNPRQIKTWKVQCVNIFRAST